MKVIELPQFNNPLSTIDLWVSMIENWGESNKEYNHCSDAKEPPPLVPCFLKMSKYLSRMFNAMRLVRYRLPIKDRSSLLNFGAPDDPEYATLLWRRYKKKGKAIPKTEARNVYSFLKKFKCEVAEAKGLLSRKCLGKMNEVVNDYNLKLASLVTDVPTKPPWIGK